MQWMIMVFALLYITTLPAQIADWFSYEEEGQLYTLAEYMDLKKAPGFSMHLQFADRDSSFQLGFRDREKQLPVAAHTPFASGSPGIALAKFAILRLVDKNCIDLDAPINTYLKRWQIPDNRLTRQSPVSVRDVMLYRRGWGGGSKPNGLAAGEKVPDLIQILQGTAPARNEPVKVRKNHNVQANSEYLNAVLLQLLLEDYYQLPFADIMQQQVLEPLGMHNSFFATSLNEEQKQKTAVGYLSDGNRLPGDYRRYPEQAAAGFWTTPADFSKLVRHVLDAVQGKDNRLLSQHLAKASIQAEHQFRSLLFLQQDDGLLYWGGNAKGFFFSMQASMAQDWIMVGATNGDLNWPVVAKTLYQGGGWMEMIRRGEQLVLITQTAEERQQLEPYLNQWKAFCKENRIQLIQKSSAAGLPADITATPALIFQSPRGRAVFGGRFTQMSEVKNFINVNRMTPRTGAAEVRYNILYQPSGRFRLAIPLKLSPPTGPQATSLAQTHWAKALTDVLLSEWKDFQMADELALHLTDRRLYLDVHPYVDADGSLHLSAAVFSQFNCIRPVYTNFGQPLSGPLAERDQLFQQLAQTIKTVIDQHMSDLALGDALYPVPQATPICSWAAMGLALPPHRHDQRARKHRVGPLPASWVHPQPIATAQPMVQFRFPSPLDRYAGTVPTLVGSLQIDTLRSRWSGSFGVAVKNLTMGSADFDKKVLKSYLQVGKYPQSSFRFRDAVWPTSWQNGSPIVTTLDGIFTLKGQEHPVQVRTELTPLLGDDGNAQMQVKVAFQLEIAQTFGLPGPDGPSFAQSHLDFNLQFLLNGA